MYKILINIGFIVSNLLIQNTYLISQDTLYLKDVITPDYKDFYTFGFGISAFNKDVVIASPGDDIFNGAAYIYNVNSSGNLSFEKRISGLDTLETEYFGGWHEGKAINLNKNQIIVGADYTGALKGAAFIFEKSANNWAQVQKLQPSDLEESDNFGSSVYINDSIAVSSAPGKAILISSSQITSGAVYIFKKNFNSKKWDLDTLLLKPINTGAFGDWISLHNNCELLISGIDNSEIFFYKKQKENNKWLLHQTIDLKTFGVESRSTCCRIDASDNFLVVSGIKYIFIFKKNNQKWELMQSILPATELVIGGLGYSVSITEKYLLLGAPFLNEDGGAALIYKLENFDWKLFKVLIPNKHESGLRFGEEVEMDGDNIYIGAPDANKGEGRIYHYNISKTTSIQNQKEVNFNAFPNPANDILFFNKIPADYTLFIYNSLGQKIYNSKVSKNELDVSFLHRGFYVLIIMDANGKNRYSSSFLKN